MNTKTILSTILLLLASLQLFAQDTIQVAVRANVQKDKIQLRWVVNSPSAWYYTNKHGVNIERYTLLRNGSALEAPEKTVLTSTPLKPQPLDNWQDIALQNNYAAIIAQALYGDDFEVSGGEKDISQIIALSQEQEQRYAMSMLSAELSYPAALFAGWAYEDTSAKKGEKYLYKVVPVNPQAKHIEDIGNAFVGLDDYQPLPKPIDLDAVWGNQSVLLTWNSVLQQQYFSSYYLERSEDGKRFSKRSETPIINTSDNERILFNDTITNDRTYYYRLIGLSSFGEESQPSDTIQGQGVSQLTFTPSIRSLIPRDNDATKVDVSWDFDERGVADITSFELRRSDSDKGPFLPVAKNIAPTSRAVVYENPEPENYLSIVAIAKDGTEMPSLAHLLIMTDTIPPATPTGLVGVVDTLGVVHLSWNKNTEKDFYGYRVFRAETEGEELLPLNNVALQDTIFTDSVNLYTLNAKVYYAVTALDERYNQSQKTEILVLEKPDIIQPSAPFITKYEATEDGVLLEWATGRENIKEYRIYRKEKVKEEKDLVKIITDSNLKTHIDSTAVGGTNYSYSITALNKSGLESEPSLTVSVKAKVASSEMKISSFKARETDKGVELKWQHTMTGIRSVTIYRKENDGKFMKWRELEVWEKRALDNTIRRKTKYEYLLVIKNREGKLTQTQTRVY